LTEGTEEKVEQRDLQHLGGLMTVWAGKHDLN
jgi:hypothetical protein